MKDYILWDKNPNIDLSSKNLDISQLARIISYAGNNSGNLILMRNDGSDYTNLFKNKPELKRIGIPAEIGRLYIMPGHLWHYVEPNESQEDRISIAYNIKF